MKWSEPCGYLCEKTSRKRKSSMEKVNTFNHFTLYSYVLDKQMSTHFHCTKGPSIHIV